MNFRDILNRIKGDNVENNQEVDIGEENILFLISLYPDGRSVRGIMGQLKEQYPSTRDSVIQRKIRIWISKMKNVGLVTQTNTQDVGQIITLTNSGVKFVRKKIKTLHNDDLDTFVTIINRLLSIPDDWAVNYYQMQATTIISRNLPLFTVVFDFKPINRVIQDLQDPFGIVLDEKRIHKFQEAIDRMDTLGLVEVDYNENDQMYIGATSIARNIISDLTKGKALDRPKKQKKIDFGIFKSVEDILVFVAVIIATLISLGFISIYFPIDAETGLLTIQMHYGIYGLGIFPLLSFLFYILISRIYYFVRTRKQ